MNRKGKKQLEAMLREDKHNSLSITEKIKLATSRRGESKRELARLQKKLKAQPVL